VKCLGVWQLCGCFDKLYTGIYCVWYCLYCVFVLFCLCIFILICFVCTSVRTTATECSSSNSSTSNNNNSISTDEQILSNRFHVKEEGTVLTLCSFSRNVGWHWNVFTIMSTKIFEVLTSWHWCIKVVCTHSHKSASSGTIQVYRHTKTSIIVSAAQLCSWFCEALCSGEVDPLLIFLKIMFALTDLVPDLLRLQSSTMTNFHFEDGGSRFPQILVSVYQITWHHVQICSSMNVITSSDSFLI
jgi:hypothetical protein